MPYFTFGLKYPSGDVEEIDVVEPSYQEARIRAAEIARDGYEPGWDLIDLPAGGSSGFFTVTKL